MLETARDCFHAAERGTIDDVIVPHATRRRIARALAMLRGKRVEMRGGSTTICRCEGVHKAAFGYAELAARGDQCL